MAERFLADRDDLRAWNLPDGIGSSTTAIGYLLGRGQSALEVAIAERQRQPSAAELRSLWTARHQSRPSPLLLVVLHPGRDGRSEASVCGPTPPSPAPVLGLEREQVERIAATALGEPNRHHAIRFLQAVLPEASTRLPGIRNLGLVATHELESGVPTRADWTTACENAEPLLGLRGRPLVEALGFTIEERGTQTYVLRASGIATAVAVFLEDDETPEAENLGYGMVSPISAALARADTEQLPYVLVTRGPQLRLYAARPETGVGRRGRSDTFVEANLGLLPSRAAGYIPLLFGARALRPGGTLEEILADSRNFVVNLSDRLRERVYTEVVPRLAAAIAVRRQAEARPVANEELPALFGQALAILFRLLFLAYAEDKDLLPYRTNGNYQSVALKTLARELATAAAEGRLDFAPGSRLLWTRFTELVQAVDTGRPAWRVPAYNGGLFSSDPSVNESGAALAGLILDDAEFGPPLYSLLVDQDEDGIVGPVDFRSLSVREFGTIYEGLLESDLAIAPVDLVTDDEGFYRPAGQGQAPLVRQGEIYLHNRSGARKSTGAYFTKPFVVEHLLDRCLGPALDEHVSRLETLLDADDVEAAAETFFDFRCADLAMGSGHFLVAAVDRIEARLSTFLARRPIPGVLAELARLRGAALEMLGENLEAGLSIETASLIRRQVARRCTYGVDLNETAVELARLALWIHTFVPGLPLSFLSHNLVVGNSLTGVASIEEASEVLDGASSADRPSIFQPALRSWLGRASDALRRLARNTDASMAEIREAREDQAATRAAVQPAARLFDLILASRLGEVRLPILPDDRELERDPQLRAAAAVSRRLQALHFPVVFPEVFLRDRPGFDVIVGNPPWDKVRFEEQQFWVARAPGLNTVPVGQRPAAIEQLRNERPTDAAQEIVERQERETLQKLIDQSYKLQGRGAHGHHDFAKVFLERSMSLLSPEGHLGLVLPRVSLVLAGWRDLRRQLLDHSTVTTLQARNKRRWLFDIHSQLMIVFISRSRAPGAAEDAAATIWPAVTSEHQLKTLPERPAIVLTRADLDTLSDSSVIPWFNGSTDLPVFETMRAFPRLGRDGGWIRAVADSSRWDFSGSGPHRTFVGPGRPNGWRVLMTRHVDAFRIATEEPFPRQIPNPSALVRLGLGVRVERGSVSLSPDHPPLVYRYATMNDNARTLIATALPAEGFLYSKGYAHGLRITSGDSTDRILALLAYLNSFTADWWVRRFVDRHMTLSVLANLPIPHWTHHDIGAAASLAAELLRRDGTTAIAGDRLLPSTDGLGEQSRTQILAGAERLVLRGFGLGDDHLRSILSDFSRDGCPDDLRVALVGNAEIEE